MYMLSRFSHVRLLEILWTVTHQVPLSMGFSRQEYWSEFPFPSPGKLPNPGIEKSLMSLVLAGRLFPTSSTWKPYVCVYMLGTLDMLPGSSRENEAPPEESDQVDCCCLVIKFFHTVHGVLKARMLKWFAISFSSGPRFVRTLYYDPSVLSGPTRHGKNKAKK